MSGRSTQTLGGTALISATDVARMAAEQKMYDDWSRRTVRVVASAARDADDCRMLLSILGLSDEVAAAARAQGTHRSAQALGRNSVAKKSGKARAHAAA